MRRGSCRNGDAAIPKFVILSHEGAYPRIVGGIGLTPDERGHEFGYWLTPDAWGRGYATEAGRAVLDAGRHALGIRQVHAGHFVDNPASGRVLTKLGFRPTGRIEERESRARPGVSHSVVYELDLDVERAMPLAA